MFSILIVNTDIGHLSYIPGSPLGGQLPQNKLQCIIEHRLWPFSDQVSFPFSVGVCALRWSLGAGYMVGDVVTGGGPSSQHVFTALVHVPRPGPRVTTACRRPTPPPPPPQLHSQASSRPVLTCGTYNGLPAPPLKITRNPSQICTYGTLILSSSILLVV